MSAEVPVPIEEKELLKKTRRHSIWIPQDQSWYLFRNSVVLEPSGQDSFYSQTCFIGFELPNPSLSYHPFKFFWWENVPNDLGKLVKYLWSLRQDYDVFAAVGPAVDRLKTYREKRACVIRRENGQNVIGIYLEGSNKLRVGSLPKP